jgi:hypothetical protein
MVFLALPGLVQPAHEEQGDDLLDHLDRIGDASRPEGVPELIDFRAKSPAIISSTRRCSALNEKPASTEKGGAGAPPLSGADWLLVNRQTTISEAIRITADRQPSSKSDSTLVHPAVKYHRVKQLGRENCVGGLG